MATKAELQAKRDKRKKDRKKNRSRGSNLLGTGGAGKAVKKLKQRQIDINKI